MAIRPVRACMVLVLVALLAPVAGAGEVLTRPPADPDPQARYLFYMHGRYVEQHGAYDTYEINQILAALASKGLVVMGEVRSDTDPRGYSASIARQVLGLLRAGVPAGHVMVAGHSRGGFMSMMVARQLQNRGLKFGVLAGCGTPGSEFRRTYERFIGRAAARMRGRFLVAWDADDDVAGNCDLAMKRAGVPFSNHIYRTGHGHRLFYEPDPVWIDPLAAFALSD